MRALSFIALLMVWRLASAAPTVLDANYEISLVASGLVSATGIAISPSGDIFVTDYRDSGPSSILRIDKTTHVVETYATGFSFATDLAFDTSGRLFVLSGSGNPRNILQVFPDGTSTPHVSGLSFSVGLEPSLDGGLFVGNAGDGTISAVDPAVAVSTYLSGYGGPNGPFGVALNVLGDLYFVQHGVGSIYVSDPNRTVKLLATLSAFGPTYVDADSSGAVFVADSLNGTIFKINGSTITTFATGFTGKANPPTIGPGDLEFDSSGNLYVSDADSLWKISPVNPAPPNLVLNGSFETPFVVYTGLHYEHRNGTELTGWTSFSTYKGTVQFNSLYGPVTDGNQAVQIEVGGDSISQSLPTVIGQTYELSFDLSAYDGYDRIGQLNVTIGPASASYTGFAGAYVRETLSFTADSTTTTLRFENAYPTSAWYNYPHIDDVSVVRVPGQTVTIDIKPGSDPNCLNIDDHGVIPVAVLGSADFDVQTIDTATLSFAGLVPREKKNGQLSCALEDVNIGGYWDLVCQFEDDSTKWAPDSDTEATLTGELTDGTPIAGTDSICLVPANGAPVNDEQAPPLDPRPWW
jgi:hypothetical protein